MNEETKAQQELRQATDKLAAYLDHCRKGLLAFDATNPAVRAIKDAVRNAEFHAGAHTNQTAEGPDALAL